jgi:hypothetical protein
MRALRPPRGDDVLRDDRPGADDRDPKEDGTDDARGVAAPPPASAGTATTRRGDDGTNGGVNTFDVTGCQPERPLLPHPVRTAPAPADDTRAPWSIEAACPAAARVGDDAENTARESGWACVAGSAAPHCG